jgi:hypothetical protein
MARKSSTRAKKSSEGKPTDQKAASSSRNRLTRTTPEREPWTPWGKWLKRRRERRERKQQERQERRQKRQEARRKRWARRRLITTRGLVFLGLLVLACTIGGLVILLLGRPYPWESVSQVRHVLNLTDQIDSQRERWGSLGIDHYQVEIEFTDQDETWCGPVTIEVQDGDIVNMPSPDDAHWFPAERCTELFGNLIIDQSFTWLEKRVSEYQPATSFLDIAFDDSFGYPMRAEAGVYDQDDRTPECCWQVSWRDLRPLYKE